MAAAEASRSFFKSVLLLIPLVLASGKAHAQALIVVSEVQTAGPGSAADEFIELYNRTNSPVDMTGWSLVYRTAAGTSDVLLVNLNSLPLGPAAYYLVADQACSCSVLADQTYAAGTGTLSAVGGGVALRAGPLNTGPIVDSVGWGTATNAFVETAPAAAPSNTQSISRTPECVDTDNNAADFLVTSPPTPRNGGTCVVPVELLDFTIE